jgi:hypothetical protein
MESEMFDKKWAQEQFNIAVKGLASQGFTLAKNQGGACMYRADKSRCAIGWLIPDDKYDINIEGSALRFSTTVQNAVMSDELRADERNLEFLCALQLVHDDLSWRATTDPDSIPSDLKASLCSFAYDFALELPEELK